MKARVFRWRGSYAVRIPKRIVEAAKLRVQEASDGIAHGEFAPKVGFHCAFCPYRNLCPATEKVVAAPQKKRVN